MEQRKGKRGSTPKTKKRKRPLLDGKVESSSKVEQKEPSSPLQFKHDSILRVNSLSAFEEEERRDNYEEKSESPSMQLGKETSTSSPEKDFAKVRRKEGKETPTKSNANTHTQKTHSPLSYSKARSGTLHGIKFEIIQLKQEPTSISGSAWVSVLDGTLSVFGSTLTVTSRPVLLSSVPFSPFIVQIAASEKRFDNEDTSKFVEDEACGLHPDARLHMKIRNQLSMKKLSLTDDKCTVLFTEPSDISTALKADDVFQTSADLCHTLGNYIKYAGLPTFSQEEKLMSTFGLKSQGEKIPRFEVWNRWDEIVDNVCKSVTEASNYYDFRLLVCGSSGTGKSMFARCISNVLVQRYKRVVFIDTDVGQPEMNPPGIVAAHMITEPRIGAAAASNRMVPICARYLGDTSPREDPDMYAKHVEQVCKHALSFATEVQCPIVVNSDGWLNGIGAQLLCHLKYQLKPSHIATLQFENIPIKDVLADICTDIPEGNVYSIISPRKDRDTAYTSAMTRDLQTAAYFCKEICMGRVYKVNIDNIKIASVDGSMDIKIQWMALNGSIVALKQETGCKLDDDDDNNILNGNICGLGLVRGIDLDERVLYVVTPIPVHILEKCDGLILSGAIQLPQAFLRSVISAQNAKKKNVPYLLDGIVSTGAAMKSRTTLNRRG